jgi:dTMP kinase
VQQSPQGLREPDLTLWFVLDPRIAAERLSQARVPDRFESQPLTFFQHVHMGYQLRCDAAPQRFIPIQADQTRELVWASVESALRARGVLT